MHMSNYLENALIDHVFRGTAFTAPTHLYIALYTAAPTDASSITTSECAGGGYARKIIDPGTTNWANTQNSGTGASNDTTGTTRNRAGVVFDAATGSWGTLTHFAIVDSASGAGNQIFWGPLDASIAPENHDVVTVAAGALTFQIDN